MIPEASEEPLCFGRSTAVELAPETRDGSSSSNRNKGSVEEDLIDIDGGMEMVTGKGSSSNSISRTSTCAFSSGSSGTQGRIEATPEDDEEFGDDEWLPENTSNSRWRQIFILMSGDATAAGQAESSCQQEGKDAGADNTQGDFSCSATAAPAAELQHQERKLQIQEIQKCDDRLERYTAVQNIRGSRDEDHLEKRNQTPSSAEIKNIKEGEGLCQSNEKQSQREANLLLLLQQSLYPSKLVAANTDSFRETYTIEKPQQQEEDHPQRPQQLQQLAQALPEESQQQGEGGSPTTKVEVQVCSTISATQEKYQQEQQSKIADNSNNSVAIDASVLDQEGHLAYKNNVQPEHGTVFDCNSVDGRKQLQQQRCMESNKDQQEFSSEDKKSGEFLDEALDVEEQHQNKSYSNNSQGAPSESANECQNNMEKTTVEQGRNPQHQQSLPLSKGDGFLDLPLNIENTFSAFLATGACGISLQHRRDQETAELEESRMKRCFSQQEAFWKGVLSSKEISSLCKTHHDTGNVSKDSLSTRSDSKNSLSKSSDSKSSVCCNTTTDGTSCTARKKLKRISSNDSIGFLWSSSTACDKTLISSINYGKGLDSKCSTSSKEDGCYRMGNHSDDMDLFVQKGSTKPETDRHSSASMDSGEKRNSNNSSTDRSDNNNINSNGREDEGDNKHPGDDAELVHPLPPVLSQLQTPQCLHREKQVQRQRHQQLLHNKGLQAYAGRTLATVNQDESVEIEKLNNGEKGAFAIKEASNSVEHQRAQQTEDEMLKEKVSHTILQGTSLETPKCASACGTAGVAGGRTAATALDAAGRQTAHRSNAATAFFWENEIDARTSQTAAALAPYSFKNRRGNVAAVRTQRSNTRGGIWEATKAEQLGLDREEDGGEGVDKGESRMTAKSTRQGENEGQALVRELVQEFDKRRTNFSVLVPKVLELIRVLMGQQSRGSCCVLSRDFSPSKILLASPPLPVCSAFSDVGQADTIARLKAFFPLFEKEGGLLLCTQGRRLESGGGGKYYFQDSRGQVIGCHKQHLRVCETQGKVASPVLLKTLLFCLVLRRVAPVKKSAADGVPVSGAAIAPTPHASSCKQLHHSAQSAVPTRVAATRISTSVPNEEQFSFLHDNRGFPVGSASTVRETIRSFPANPSKTEAATAPTAQSAASRQTGNSPSVGAGAEKVEVKKVSASTAPGTGASAVQQIEKPTLRMPLTPISKRQIYQNAIAAAGAAPDIASSVGPRERRRRSADEAWSTRKDHHFVQQLSRNNSCKNWMKGDSSRSGCCSVASLSERASVIEEEKRTRNKGRNKSPQQRCAEVMPTTENYCNTDTENTKTATKPIEEHLMGLRRLNSSAAKFTSATTTEPTGTNFPLSLQSSRRKNGMSTGKSQLVTPASEANCITAEAHILENSLSAGGASGALTNYHNHVPSRMTLWQKSAATACESAASEMTEPNSSLCVSEENHVENGATADGAAKAAGGDLSSALMRLLLEDSGDNGSVITECESATSSPMHSAAKSPPGASAASPIVRSAFSVNAANSLSAVHTGTSWWRNGDIGGKNSGKVGDLCAVRSSNPQRLVRVYRSLVLEDKTHVVEHLLRVWSMTLHVRNAVHHPHDDDDSYLVSSTASLTTDTASAFPQHQQHQQHCTQQQSTDSRNDNSSPRNAKDSEISHHSDISSCELYASTPARVKGKGLDMWHLQQNESSMRDSDRDTSSINNTGKGSGFTKGDFDLSDNSYANSTSSSWCEIQQSTHCDKKNTRSTNNDCHNEEKCTNMKREQPGQTETSTQAAEEAAAAATESQLIVRLPLEKKICEKVLSGNKVEFSKKDNLEAGALLWERQDETQRKTYQFQKLLQVAETKKLFFRRLPTSSSTFPTFESGRLLRSAAATDKSKGQELLSSRIDAQSPKLMRHAPSPRLLSSTHSSSSAVSNSFNDSNKEFPNSSASSRQFLSSNQSNSSVSWRRVGLKSSMMALRAKADNFPWQPFMSVLWVKPLPVDQSMTKWSRGTPRTNDVNEEAIIFEQSQLAVLPKKDVSPSAIFFNSRTCAGAATAAACGGMTLVDIGPAAKTKAKTFHHSDASNGEDLVQDSVTPLECCSPTCLLSEPSTTADCSPSLMLSPLSVKASGAMLSNSGICSTVDELQHHQREKTHEQQQHLSPQLLQALQQQLLLLMQDDRIHSSADASCCKKMLSYVRPHPSAKTANRNLAAKEQIFLLHQVGGGTKVQERLMRGLIDCEKASECAAAREGEKGKAEFSSNGSVNSGLNCRSYEAKENRFAASAAAERADRMHDFTAKSPSTSEEQQLSNKQQQVAHECSNQIIQKLTGCTTAQTDGQGTSGEDIDSYCRGERLLQQQQQQQQRTGCVYKDSHHSSRVRDGFSHYRNNRFEKSTLLDSLLNKQSCSEARADEQTGFEDSSNACYRSGDDFLGYENLLVAQQQKHHRQKQKLFQDSNFSAVSIPSFSAADRDAAVHELDGQLCSSVKWADDTTEGQTQHLLYQQSRQQHSRTNETNGWTIKQVMDALQASLRTAKPFEDLVDAAAPRDEHLPQLSADPSTSRDSNTESDESEILHLLLHLLESSQKDRSRDRVDLKVHSSDYAGDTFSSATRDTDATRAVNSRNFGKDVQQTDGSIAALISESYEGALALDSSAAGDCMHTSISETPVRAPLSCAIASASPNNDNKAATAAVITGDAAQNLKAIFSRNLDDYRANSERSTDANVACTAAMHMLGTTTRKRGLELDVPLESLYETEDVHFFDAKQRKRQPVAVKATKSNIQQNAEQEYQGKMECQRASELGPVAAALLQQRCKRTKWATQQVATGDENQTSVTDAPDTAVPQGEKTSYMNSTSSAEASASDRNYIVADVSMEQSKASETLGATLNATGVEHNLREQSNQQRRHELVEILLKQMLQKTGELLPCQT